MSEWIQKDKRYTWHPFTQHQTERDPIVITRAEGAYLYDENGNAILDAISSWWTCTHGHAHPELNKALTQQAATLEHVMFAGFSHPPAIRLAEKLAHLLPGDLNRVFFSDNGSTAVEVAIKIAYQYWHNKGEHRTRFIAFEGAYHGDTLGAMSVGKGCGFFEVYKDLLFSVEAIPYAETWENDTGHAAREEESIRALSRLLDESQSIAALIVEPLMQGAGGMRLCRPEYLKRITDMAQNKGVLVIYDEVAVGFGRSGRLFACEKIGTTPDLICLSKGLTAGYMPMSVTVARDTVFDTFLSDTFKTAFLHGHSFTANPLACAVALRSLELFEEHRTLARIAEIEQKHQRCLQRLHTHPLVEKARCLGSVLAFNLNAGESAYKSPLSEQLRDWYLSHGVNIRPLGNTVYLMPPYCTTDAQLDEAYTKIFEGLDYILKQTKTTQKTY